MENMNHKLTGAAIGMALLLMTTMTGTASAADLYSLPTEEGLELFLLDNHLASPSLDVRAGAAPNVTMNEEGAITINKPDSLMKQFDRNKNSESALTYQGFQTSPLGRVLSVKGQFNQNLGSANMETADTKQAERHFDLGTPSNQRGGWEEGQGFRILSF